MILNRSGQYILQALIHLLTRPDPTPVRTHELARALDLPQPYLAKLLQGPCRAGWLTSTRGRGGGFVLNEGAERVTLLEIILLTRGERGSRDCLLGFKACDDDSACVMHGQWKPIKQDILGRFGHCTLGELAVHPQLQDVLRPVSACGRPSPKV